MIRLGTPTYRRQRETIVLLERINEPSNRRLKTRTKAATQTIDRDRDEPPIHSRVLLALGLTLCLILSSACAFGQNLSPITPVEESTASASASTSTPAPTFNSPALDSRLDLPLTPTLPSTVQPPTSETPETVPVAPCPAPAGTIPSESAPVVDQDSNSPSDLISRLESPKGAVRSVQFLLIMGAFTLVPALLIMTTSFVRIIVVLSLLRQALGVQNLPPQQVVSGLAVFMTLFIMYPTFQEVYHESLIPYQNDQISLEDAWTTGIQPVRQFMSAQIQKAGNDADVWLFWRYAPNAPSGQEAENLTYDDVPTQVLVPAFMVSELKIAFLMGVKFFIPFLIIDFLVASITVSMGIMMLPPAMISLPLKLLLFVMLDGWRLVVESLIQSFF